MTLHVFVDAQAYLSAFFGEGYGPVLLDYVNCNGDEASLLNCEQVNTTLCDHSSDAGVDCFGEPLLVNSIINWYGTFAVSYTHM